MACDRAARRQIRARLAAEIAGFKQQYGFVPGLTIIQVGNREDSSVYVRMKEKAAIEVPAGSGAVGSEVHVYRPAPLPC